MEKISIVKIGGNIIDDGPKLSSFLKDFSLLRGYKILVHGGGKLATQLAEKLGIPQQMIEGRRITDPETLKIITMVYAGYINKIIVAQLQSNKCNAIGLCGADGDLIRSHKRTHPRLDYGFVGDIDHVNSGFIQQLFQENLIPVIAPVSHDNSGQLLNTNADTIAKEIAQSLSDKYFVTLIYCFEKKGVLQNPGDENSVIPEMDFAYYKALKDKKIIHSGMIPKLDNGFAALHKNVKKVIIGNSEYLHQLIEGKSGTTII